MSEYQYYEFQAVDRPLTKKQMDELRAYSSRAHITPTSFVNVYNWGDFKGNPEKWMEKYFEAFLYLANWGNRRLMLRIPKRLLPPDVVSIYCTAETLSYRIKDDQFILSFSSEEEEQEWTDGEGWLDSIVSLRSDLMHGDHRCLYLGWLLAVQGGMLDNDTLEPPLPPGLRELNAPLPSLADFLRIDPDLITAAAEKSDEKIAFRLSKEDISRWLADTPQKEKDAILAGLIEGDNPYLAEDLRRRALCALRGQTIPGISSQASGCRSVGQLIARADAIAEERREKETQQRARMKAKREREEAEKRKKHLESFVGKESDLWAKVEKLIAAKQPKQYDEAISVLRDLRDLADMEDRSSEFLPRMSALYREHERKTALLNRFRKARLLG